MGEINKLRKIASKILSEIGNPKTISKKEIKKYELQKQAKGKIAKEEILNEVQAVNDRSDKHCSWIRKQPIVSNLPRTWLNHLPYAYVAREVHLNNLLIHTCLDRRMNSPWPYKTGDNSGKIESASVVLNFLLSPIVPDICNIRVVHGKSPSVNLIKSLYVPTMWFKHTETAFLMGLTALQISQSFLQMGF